MKKILYVFYAALIFISCKFSQGQTANDFKSVVPYTGLYGYGNNLGYYGSHLTNSNVAQLAFNSGARSLRPSLPGRAIIGSSPTFALNDFKYYQQLGIIDMAAFVGEPNVPGINGSSSTSADNRETIIFPGCTERAKTFKGVYESVWLDAAKTQINPANTFANYMYKTVSTYGPYVKFWEIINEPDFTYVSEGWNDYLSGSWIKVNPRPQDLNNLLAPMPVYIRHLRVAYEIIKRLYPNSIVCSGSIGYVSTLDVLCRNTDNPGSAYPQWGGTGVEGSVSTLFPLKGSAYFEAVDYHDYPHNKDNYWDNANGGSVKYARYSDFFVDYHLKYKSDYTAVLNKYGYDGITYPTKRWIVTETDVARKAFGTHYGSIDIANNYIIKCHILSQVNGIDQVYKYGMGESANFANDEFNKMGVYGDLSPSTTTVANAPHTEQFKATATLTNLLYGRRYNATLTTALKLPSTIRGGVFTGVDTVTVLWAVTKTDLSEVASATYTFPFAFTGTRKEWDFSATNTSTAATQTVILTGAPSFFKTQTLVPTPPVSIPPIVIPPLPARKALYTLWDDGTWSNN